MRIITPVCFCFALTTSTFVLSNAPALAFEVPSPTVTAADSVIKTGGAYRAREARKRYERCERVRNRCDQHSGLEHRKYHKCLKRHGCASSPQERETMTLLFPAG